MAKLKIAIVISTTRAARFGHKPAQWVQEIAAQRDDIETEIVDLRDFPMPFFDEVASNAWAPSQNPVAQRWQKKVAEFDGFVFVTAEYNHGISAVLKNALDYAYPEWNRKAAGFVGYGSVGGARAVEQLRLVLAELQMATIRTGVYIQGADFMAVWREGKELKDIAYLQAGVKDMLDQLIWWTRALKTARDQDQPPRPRNTDSIHSHLPKEHHVHPSREEDHRVQADHGGRRRASAPRLRLRRDQGVRSVPAAGRLPQRQSRRVQGRLPLASAPRHRDHHLCAGRRGRSRRQPGQQGQCSARATCSG